MFSTPTVRLVSQSPKLTCDFMRWISTSLPCCKYRQWQNDHSRFNPNASMPMKIQTLELPVWWCDSLSCTTSCYGYQTGDLHAWHIKSDISAALLISTTLRKIFIISSVLQAFCHQHYLLICGGHCSTSRMSDLGLYSLSGKTSYCQISWSLEAARLDVAMVVSLWNLTGTSTALLPRYLPNFRAIGKV